MRSGDTETTPGAELHGQGRWIRPLEDGDDPGGGLADDVLDDVPDDVLDDVPDDVPERDEGELETLLLGAARGRLNRLSVLEREVEERIRSLWLEARAAIAAEEERTRQDRDGLLARARIESQEARVQSQKEGRTEGFREGFEKGKAEGRRLGFEQGRIDGSREGRASGRLDEQSRMQAKVATALEALAAAARDLEEESHGLRHEAQAGVVKLSVGIAAKIIRREVELDASAVMGNVREAVRQIFKGCDVTLQLHPEDVRAVEEALGGNPRWAEDLTNVSVKPASEIARGGCRLLSGAGVVDLTVESQLELVEEALLASVADISRDADHRVLPDRPEEGGPR